MPQSLAEMRAQGRVRRPRRSVPMCLAPDLMAEIQRLLDEKVNLTPPEEPEDGPRRPKRVNGDRNTARLREINERLAELDGEIAEATGYLTLEGIDPGLWRQWVDAHPPRDAEEPGARRDVSVTRGLCNADDLIADLRRYAVAWNDEPLEDDADWEYLVTTAEPGDLADAARHVVTMHEDSTDLGKLRRVLQDSRKTETT